MLRHYDDGKTPEQRAKHNELFITEILVIISEKRKNVKTDNKRQREYRQFQEG
jgi:hypothetical protein